MTTQTRIALTASLAAALGIWIYAVEAKSGFPNTPAVGICALALMFVIGCIVKRWWMLLAILGPLAVLAYLEVSGFESIDEDWANQPLLSPSGIAYLVFLGFLMFCAIALGKGLQVMHRQCEIGDGDSSG